VSLQNQIKDSEEQIRKLKVKLKEAGKEAETIRKNLSQMEEEVSRFKIEE
jgi:septal ring factor EnvC (AmiA/AmiB activator)